MTTEDPYEYPLTLRSLVSEGDLGLCPYNLRGREGADPEGICFQMGICANPDMPEPHCHTDHPREGWNSERLLDIVSITDLDRPLADLLRSPTAAVEHTLVNELVKLFEAGTTHDEVYYMVESFYRQQMLRESP